jgi:hypothetical protein
MLTPRGSSATVGDVVDLSVRGAAVLVDVPVPVKTGVTLLLDPSGLPERTGPLPLLNGTVISVRRAPDGRERLGVRFAKLSGSNAATVASVCEALLVDSQTPRIDGDRISRSGEGLRLGGTPEGRERLFQLAVERLGRAEYALAREAAIYAMKGESTNPSYRALVHRVNAEEALAAGTPDKARREIAQASTLLPDDEEIKALKARIEAPPEKKGLWSRLTGR